MNQDTDALDVRLYGRRAGELRKERDGTLSFAYDGAYAESDAPVPISLSAGAQDPLRERADDDLVRGPTA